MDSVSLATPHRPIAEKAPASSLGTPSSKGFSEDTPVRTKVAFLIIVAAVGGSVIGMMEVGLGQRVWPQVAGLTVLVGVLLSIGRTLIWSPIEKLLEQHNRFLQLNRPSVLQALPMNRQDEVGQLARAFYKVGTQRIRDHHDAVQLRRTMDDQVEKATSRATQQLEQIANRDPLTGLGNRRFLQDNLEPLIQSAIASGTELACIAIDMDNFKTINDTQGHAKGDELLVLLSELIRGSIRHEDYGVRLGGDEFLVLMAGSSKDRAMQLAKQLQAHFRQQTRLILPTQIQADLSLGVVMLKNTMTSGEQLLEQADANLYAAKRAGKGQVVG